MIVDLKKYLFVGVKADVDRFFDRAQERGFIEFISEAKRKRVDVPEAVKEFQRAIKILRKQPVKETVEKDLDLKEAHQMAGRVIELFEEIERFQDERRMLEAEIARVEPFGDFSMDDLDFITREGKRHIQFFCIKTGKIDREATAPGLIYVATEYDLDYFVAINTEHMNYPGMIEMRIDRPIGELQEELRLAHESIDQMEDELKSYAGYISYFIEALKSELNTHNLLHAKGDVSNILDENLFSIEAWVPKSKLDQIKPLVDDFAIYAEEIAIEKEERIPTCMENKGLHHIGEDLVRVYDTPAPTDKDPSFWVLAFFALFFAMIVADGGYGLLYLALAFLLRWKFKELKGAGKRFLKLLFILGATCVIWGALTTSFFGIDFKPDGVMSNFSIVRYLAVQKADYHLGKKDDVYKEWVEKYPQIKDAKSGEEFLDKAVGEKEGRQVYEVYEQFKDNIFMEFSLLIGVIHITCSFLRYLRRNWAGIGWIAFMFGGYLYFPSVLNATSLLEFLGFVHKEAVNVYGLQLLYGGIGAAVVLALVQRGLKGLHEITSMVQVFADVLSYLRLYALALASTIMASTFNNLGSAVGFVIGIVVILMGHGINILLGTMSGVIHGLRLNFIEWYHYSFEGGGKLFNPLRKL